ncbi:amino acid permease/ SLC12A domain-containing protein [Chytriomyces sp. MP71]|nr:amino acid permease/ SLC12A domain-containing protein [Chytriomyces sp. MP71]
MALTEASPLLPQRGAALVRGLKARHLIMMSVGGTIGTGLFVASGQTVAAAGPAGALVAYLIVGVMVYCVLTSLGEMATLMPVSGSFHEYAALYVDPALGWTLGWNYWLQWAISLTSEVVASGLILNYWFPSVPAWMLSAVVLAVLVFVNTRSVSSYGETEYWLSMIKVIAVLGFVVVGFHIDIFGSQQVPAVGLQNWKIDGAPFKNGFGGVFSIISIAFFAFGGTELVGVSAGEVENPRKNVPIAINQTFWRILIFYVSSIGIIGLLIPNNDPSLSLSASSGDVSIAPFTLILQRAGFTSAANVMNLVILSAVVSTANSAMYAASRTLMALSMRGQAPRIFGLVNHNGIPVYALGMTVAIGSIAFLGIALGEGALFNWLLTITGTSGLLTWMSISVCHLRFRAAFKAQGKSRSTLPYLAPFYPYSDYAAIIMGLFILIGQAVSALYSPSVDVSVLVSVFGGVPLFFGLLVGYKFLFGTTLVPLRDCNFDFI